VARAQQGEREAFGVLYDRYLPRVYAYCYRLLGEREAAEDANTEVFMRTLSALYRPTTSGPSAPGSSPSPTTSLPTTCALGGQRVPGCPGDLSLARRAAGGLRGPRRLRGPCGRAASPRESLGEASTPANGWGDTGGWWSERRPGYSAGAAWASATSGEPICSRVCCTWPARVSVSDSSGQPTDLAPVTAKFPRGTGYGVGVDPAASGGRSRNFCTRSLA
jgi:hypothetical protein